MNATSHVTYLSTRYQLQIQCHPGCAAGPALAVQGYATAACRINVANWLLLLSAALAMAGSISWLTTMRAALSATEQSGSPWGKTLDTLSTHTLLTHPATAATATTASGWQLTSAATAQLTPPEPVGVRTQAAEGERDTGSGDSVLDVGQLWTYSTCPAGCVDLGVIAQVLGLPWPCFCQVWLLGDLTKELQKVSRGCCLCTSEVMC